MSKGILLWFTLFLFLMPLGVCVHCSTGSFLNPRVRITDFDLSLPNGTINVGEEFYPIVSIRNDRFIPVKVVVEINLLDGILGLKQKKIDEKSKWIWRGLLGKSIPIKFKCVIQEQDINCHIGKYRIKVVLFVRPLFFNWFQFDSEEREIQVRTKYSEKDKVRIINATAPPEIKGEKENKFNISVNVTNEGSFNATAWVRVDLVEKSFSGSILESFEKLGFLDVKRTELGKSKGIEIERNNGKKEMNVSCILGKTDSEKERFFIQAVLFVNLDGKHYQVHSSPPYEI